MDCQSEVDWSGVGSVGAAEVGAGTESAVDEGGDEEVAEELSGTSPGSNGCSRAACGLVRVLENNTG